MLTFPIKISLANVNIAWYNCCILQPFEDFIGFVDMCLTSSLHYTIYTPYFLPSAINLVSGSGQGCIAIEEGGCSGQQRIPSHTSGQPSIPQNRYDV